MVIEVRLLCEKVLKGISLDVFYIIMTGGELSRKEIHYRYREAAGIKSESSQSFRFKIDEALAILKSVMFVDSRRDGSYEIYFLTSYGLHAKAIIADLIEKDPANILRGSKVVARDVT